MARLLIALLFFALAASASSAQTIWERLVMPGDLVEGHANLQNDCSNCHIDFSKGAQDSLCLDCHKEIAEDMRGETGFHGKSPEVGSFSCSHCHTDHEGRDAIATVVDRETFNHNLTDFPLSGAHITTECSECHEDDKPASAASQTCFECHKEDDRHDGNLGELCGDCHKTTKWADVTAFDHSKTDFPLENSHARVACDQCHAGETYEDLPLTCIGCHRIQDVHENRFGEKCQDCHKSTKWTEISFDHNKDTDFTLTGAHIEVTCNECHADNIFKHPMEGTCAECHSGLDDPHRGALGSSCDSCHDTSSWIANVRFDHDLTNFPLIGQHSVVACEACHSNQTYQIENTGCSNCHLQDDVHRGRLGEDCATCHNPNGWALWLFDHNRQTRFALTGAHAKAKCETCHTRPASSVSNLPLSCIGCHAGDDVHRGAFGRSCGLCHSTATFKGARLK